MTHARAAELRSLVERVRDMPRPVTPLDMCVSLYVLGHAYPNMIDPTRGMYRPLAMYRALAWFAARASASGANGAIGANGAEGANGLAQHVERLQRLESLMDKAIAFAGQGAVWSIDHRRPYRVSPVDEFFPFDLTAHRQVVFRFVVDGGKGAGGACGAEGAEGAEGASGAAGHEGVSFVVHMHCRFHSDPYTNAIEALVDAVVNERRVDRPSACLVLALDAGMFVVPVPPNVAPLLDFVRVVLRSHFGRLNAELERGLTKKRIPRYASRAMANGTPLSGALDAAVDVYVDHIVVRNCAVFVTDVADSVRDDAFESVRCAALFAPYTGLPITCDEARICGEVAAARGLCGAHGAGLPHGAGGQAAPHGAHYSEALVAAIDHATAAARVAMDTLCVRPRLEVTLRAVMPSGLAPQAPQVRTLRGRADVMDARRTILEFKLNVTPTAMRQLACYLAMIGGGTGYVVGLHDAAVHRVTVRDPGAVLACL